jgi:hypothetical protein
MGYGGSSHKNGVKSGWFRLTPITVEAHIAGHKPASARIRQ